MAFKITREGNDTAINAKRKQAWKSWLALTVMGLIVLALGYLCGYSLAPLSLKAICALLLILIFLEVWQIDRGK